MRTSHAALLAALLALPVLVEAQCEFDNGNITNPFDASCGGRTLTYVETGAGADEIQLGYPVPVPIDSLTPVDGFRTYDSLHARHQALAAANPDIRAVEIGQTVAGRTIWAYRLGDADSLRPDGQPEGAALVNGGIHAREWQSPEVLTALLEHFDAFSDDAGVGQFLAEQLEIVLIPVLNIDGFLQTQRFPTTATADERQPRDGRMRRKNLRHPFNTTTPVDEDLATVEDNFYGVDLNRNTAHGFAQNGGSSPNEISLVYRALAPASEPEIHALLDAAAMLPDGALRLYVDVHSFGRVYFTKMIGEQRRDDVTRALRDRMRAVTGLRYASTDDPPGSEIGLTSDFFAFEHRVPSWTLELEPRSAADFGAAHGHAGFILPENRIARVRDEMAETHLLGFYRQAGPPRIAAVHVSEADGAGASKYVAEWSAGDPRVLDVSVSEGLQPGQRYRLWLAFDKPMRWRDEGGGVRNYRGQSVPLFPQITLEAPALGADGESFTIIGDADAWLDVAGGAPDGFRRYRDDALAVEFTLPATFDVTVPTPLVLAVDASDLSEMALDANPGTPVGWLDGRWTGYENARGETGDEGGSDCQLQPFVAPAGQPDAPAPGDTAQCKAAAPPPPPAPPPPAPLPPPPTTSSGGGGGSAALLLLGIALIARRR